MRTEGRISLRGMDLGWRRLEPGDLAEFAAEVGPTDDQTALRSVRGRAFLLWLAFRRDQSSLTFADVLGWPVDLIASPNVSRFLQKAAPDLGIELPKPPPSMFGRGATRPAGRPFFDGEGNPIRERG